VSVAAKFGFDERYCRLIVTLPPALYELIQNLCGLRQTVDRLAPHCAGFAGATVLDVGGGTGLYARILPPTARYICLDSDGTRLARAKAVTPRLIRCDATQIALAPQSVDGTLCIAVAHHLPDEALHRLLLEMARVVRQRLIFLEPLLPVPSTASRLLRKLDDGAYFRTEDALQRAVSTCFSCDHIEKFTLFHRYWLCVATPTREHG
jgi:ubiquinone/menaquinone biosynthesis C-methylase UbiE